MKKFIAEIKAKRRACKNIYDDPLYKILSWVPIVVSSIALCISLYRLIF